MLHLSNSTQLCKTSPATKLRWHARHAHTTVVFETLLLCNTVPTASPAVARADAQCRTAAADNVNAAGGLQNPCTKCWQNCLVTGCITCHQLLTAIHTQTVAASLHARRKQRHFQGVAAGLMLGDSVLNFYLGRFQLGR